MKNNYTFILFMGIFLCLSSALYAQQFQVNGRVINKDKEALEGATIIFYAHDTIASATISNKKGDFKIEHLPKGSYFYQISLLGYKPEEKNLTVSTDMSLGLIQLQEDTQMLDEVVINADKRDLITTKAGISTFHISDKLLNTAQNAYEALREIPLLMVDATNRKIQLNDGSSPLILINGVSRPGFINSLDPKDIESVEVIENPSARYRGNEGIGGVLNLKIKRKKQLSSSFNLYTRQSPELIFGVTGGSFEMGNSKASLFLNAQQFYFHNDERSTESNTQTGTTVRELTGNGEYNANMVYLSLGGDWLASDKNYFSFGIEYVTNPSTYDSREEGLAWDEKLKKSALQMEQRLENEYYTNVYSLFYRHTFTKEQHLEATAKFGLFGSGNDGWREENSELYAYKNLIDMDNDKKSFSFELNYDLTLPDKFTFNFGSNTYWQKTKLDNLVDLLPVFDYKGVNEYVYGDIRSLANSKFSYMLSLGADIVFTNADGVKNHYINFVPSLSLTYNFNENNTLQLNASRDRVSPPLSKLNPQNVSTDSLRVYIGNPYLKPMINNNFRLSYQWKRKGVYLAPFIQYSIYQDMIQSIGSVEGMIYTQTYANKGEIGIFRTGVTSRFNLGQYGNISATPYYQKRVDDEMPFSGNSWGANINLYLAYKKVSIDAFAYYNGFSYSRTTKNYMTPVSEVTFNWQLPKGWTLIASVRDIGKSLNKSWGKEIDYSFYNRTHNKDRGAMFLIGFSYYFRNKVNQPNRNKKRMYNSDEGVGGIKLQ